MKLLVIGAGRIGSLHAMHADQDPRVERLVIVEPDAGRRLALAAAGSRACFVDTPAAALELGVDAGIVASPSWLHYAHAAQLLAAGVPTFCEKPLALTLAEVDRLAKLARPPLTLMVGFQRRFDDAFRRLAEACAEARERGEPPTLYRLASGDRSPPPPDHGPAGSLFHDMMIHDFDLLDLFSAEVDSVTAHASARGLHPGSTGWGTATAVCQLDDGGLAILVGSRQTGSGYEVSSQVTCSSGIFCVGIAPARAPYEHLDDHVARAPARWRDFTDRFGAAYRRELTRFLDRVEGTQVTLPGPREMCAALRLADAAEASAQSGARSPSLRTAAPRRAPVRTDAQD
jgi:myo-inositol 2-dehydrogenase / D-chiro-inositol 1-dehydrogenase